MRIPFSINEFLDVFGRYNLTVWPVQLFFYVLAIVSITAIVKNGKQTSRIVFSILSFFWIWMGLVYHILFFSSINEASFVFGIAFILQGILFLYNGVVKRIQLKFELNITGVTGIILIAYALIVYPAIGFIDGHIYPRTPTFGVPCPTTIFTFGMLLFSVYRISWTMLIIPFLWSLVGFSAALNLSIKEDFGLVAAGIASTALLLFYKPIQKS